MQAIVYHNYGSPDVLKLETVEKPLPGPKQVLLRVCAASANPLDWHFMRGAPLLVRMGEGLRRPKNIRLGVDVAGIVEAVGQDVTQFQPGDEVFGQSRRGSFGEYVSAREDQLVPKPANLSFEQGATVAVAAITALQGLRDAGEIQAGQKVLINGASGGVGTFAVQLAKVFGAEVTAVCSTRNLELVRSIGADHVIDYTQQDFTRSGQRYDLILDNVGNLPVFDIKRALTAEGMCVIAGFTSVGGLLQAVALGGLVSKTGRQKIGLMPVANVNKADMVFLQSLLAAGKIVPVIDRRYPLSETAEAIRYLETGRARGKVVINVA